MTTERWLIRPHRVRGEGEGPMQFLEVRRHPGGAWERMPDEIDGYDHREGEQAEIEVRISPVADPPAGGSSLRFQCTRIIRRNARDE